MISSIMVMFCIEKYIATWETNRGNFVATELWYLNNWIRPVVSWMMHKLKNVWNQIVNTILIIFFYTRARNLLQNRLNGPLQIISTIACHNYNCCHWCLTSSSKWIASMLPVILSKEYYQSWYLRESWKVTHLAPPVLC